MKRTVAGLFVPLLLVLAVACNGDGGNDASPDPTGSEPPATETAAGTATATETATATAAPTEPPAVCLQADEYAGDGQLNIEQSGAHDALRLTGLRWAAHEGCERFVIDLALPNNSPATSPGPVSATWDRDLGVLSVELGGVLSVAPDSTDADVPGDLLDRVYVVRGGEPSENRVLVQMHLQDAAEAAVFLLSEPARVVVDLRPGGTPVPPFTAHGSAVVLRAPREGAASYPLTVNGYTRGFEANAVVRLVQDGVVVFEEATTANDWTEMWGWFELTVNNGPVGPVELQVGEYAASDGSWQGVSVELEME